MGLRVKFRCRAKLEGGTPPSNTMNIQSVTIVLLLIASALTGCVTSSESESESELAGTSWMIIADMDYGDDYLVYYCSNDGEEYAQAMGGILCPEGPGNVPTCPDGQPCVCIDVDDSCTDGDDDWGYESKAGFYQEMVAIREFRADGIIEDFLLPNADGCPMGTIPYSNDESLCTIDPEMELLFGDLGATTWEIDDSGYLVMSNYMTMSEEDYGMEMDETMCNMIADIYEEMTHYSIVFEFNWIDEDTACEMITETKMKVILGDGNIVYYLVHPVVEGQLMAMTCGVGIEWTGQDELKESEISEFETLLSECPAPIPYDAVVWECDLQVRLDSLADFSQQSFNDSVSESPDYPEWCGTVIPQNIALDDSEDNLPPSDEMYGLHYGDGVWARNATHWMDSWISQQECNEELGGEWDENYGMCAVPIDCPFEADSQLIYTECSMWSWTMYQWSGDYLYTGMPSDGWM